MTLASEHQELAEKTSSVRELLERTARNELLGFAVFYDELDAANAYYTKSLGKQLGQSILINFKERNAGVASDEKRLHFGLSFRLIAQPDSRVQLSSDEFFVQIDAIDAGYLLEGLPPHILDEPPQASIAP